MMRAVRSLKSLRERARNDTGITLAELIVSMALTTLILTAVSMLLISGYRANTAATRIGTNTQAATNAMNEVARALRAATTNPVAGQTIDDPAFLAAAAESVTFYAYINLDSSAEQPVKIRFSLDAKRNLVETKWSSYVISDGYWGFNASPTSSRVVAGPIAVPVTGGAPLFGYLSSSKASLAVNGTVAAANLAAIDSVAVNAEVGSTTGGLATNTTIANTVGLPNLGN